MRDDESETMPPLILNPKNLNQTSAARYSTFLGFSFMDLSSRRFWSVSIAFFIILADKKKHIVGIPDVVAVHL